MRIDKPCPDGSAIRSTDGSLHCSLCQSHVLDLREVTKRRAEALVAAARRDSDRVCVRMFTDRHGHASFLLEPVRPRTRLPIAEVALVATLASACGATGSGVAETPTTVQPRDTPRGESCARSPEGSTEATSGSETTMTPVQGTGTGTEQGTTPETMAHPQTNAPRDFPVEEVLDGGLEL